MAITIQRSGASLGHEICGVDIAAGVSDADFAAIEKALALAEAGKVCVVDVRVLPGYEGNPSGSGAQKKG